MDKKTRNAILKIIAVFIFLFILGGFTGIGHILFPVAQKYQQAYNDKRKTLGVLPLPDDWKTAGKNEETKSWFPKNVQNKYSAHRTGKVIMVRGDTLYGEIDWIAPADSSNINGESLTVEYAYLDKHWTYVYLNKNLAASGQVDTLTKRAFDSVLVSWKFNYQKHLND